MPILITLFGILILLILIIHFKVNTFLALILVALGIGLAQGMQAMMVLKSMQHGVSSTLGELAFILCIGAMLGGLIAESGATQQITDSLIKIFGTKRIHWALVISGFIIGIPLFYNVAFVMMIPLIFAVVSSTRLPVLFVALPMISALSVTHGFLPPHPAPTAIAVIYKADVGLTLLYGIIIAVPSLVVAGPIFAQAFRNLHTKMPQGLQAYKPIPVEQRPSLGMSFFIALLPIMLISLGVIFQLMSSTDFIFLPFIKFVAEPVVALLIALILAIWFLGLSKGKNMEALGDIFSNAIKDMAMILMIIGAGGALKQVLIDSGISTFIVESFKGTQISPLIMAWIIAAALRISLGSATLAALTTGGILSPMVSEGLVNPELLVLATGAGSLIFSQVNDTGFWMFKEYFNLTIWETFKSWSMMETIISSIGLIGCLILDIFV